MTKQEWLAKNYQELKVMALGQLADMKMAESDSPFAPYVRRIRVDEVVQQVCERLLKSSKFSALCESRAEATDGPRPGSFANSAVRSVIYNALRAEAIHDSAMSAAREQKEDGLYRGGDPMRSRASIHEADGWFGIAKNPGADSLNDNAKFPLVSTVDDDKIFARRWLSGRSKHGLAGTEGCSGNDLYHSTGCECGGISIPSPTQYRRAG